MATKSGASVSASSARGAHSAGRPAVYVPRSVEFPDSIANLKNELLKKSNEFFKRHSMQLKIRRLPLSPEDVVSSCPTEDRSKERQLPLYHFITRQKRHMTEQLMHNRCVYLTTYNTPKDAINARSPWRLMVINDSVLSHVNSMSRDFDDPEFSGVWISVHTQPFLTECEYGNLARSKIVAWALIEVLTTNERCLKAVYVHPNLRATSATDLLKGFLPRVMLEAFELVAPQDEDTCPWKFFYAWLNDFDMLPRQTWLILCAEKYLGLPKHCDNLGEFDCNVLGHIDGKEGIDKDTSCPCQKSTQWDDWDQILVGCTEALMYKRMSSLLRCIPSSVCQRLHGDVELLPCDVNDPRTMAMLQDTQENSVEIRQAETLGLSDTEIHKLLKAIYGKWAKNRFIDEADDGISTAGGTRRGAPSDSDSQPQNKKASRGD